MSEHIGVVLTFLLVGVFQTLLTGQRPSLSQLAAMLLTVLVADLVLRTVLAQAEDKAGGKQAVVVFQETKRSTRR